MQSVRKNHREIAATYGTMVAMRKRPGWSRSMDGARARARHANRQGNNRQVIVPLPCAQSALRFTIPSSASSSTPCLADLILAFISAISSGVVLCFSKLSEMMEPVPYRNDESKGRMNCDFSLPLSPPHGLSFLYLSLSLSLVFCFSSCSWIFVLQSLGSDDI